MTKISKLALTALITFAFGVGAIDNAVAGQVKGRIVNYTVKSEAFQGHSEEHWLGSSEGKGIISVFQGNPSMDGAAYRSVVIFEINAKTRQGFIRIYSIRTDKDGDKVYAMGTGKPMKEKGWEGEWSYVKGTDKYEGIKGGGTWTSYNVAENRSYADYEGEIELPQR